MGNGKNVLRNFEMPHINILQTALRAFDVINQFCQNRTSEQSREYEVIALSLVRDVFYAIKELFLCVVVFSLTSNRQSNLALKIFQLQRTLGGFLLILFMLLLYHSYVIYSLDQLELISGNNHNLNLPLILILSLKYTMFSFSLIYNWHNLYTSLSAWKDDSSSCFSALILPLQDKPSPATQAKRIIV